MDIQRIKAGKFATVLTVAALLLSVVWSAAPALAAAPAAPVIGTLTQSTTTNPIMLSGTAEASSTILVTGGLGTATASTTAGGDWSLSVNLTPNLLNILQVVAINSSAEVSATSTVSITHDTTGPSAPVVTFPISPHSTSTSPIVIYGTAEASSTISISGGSSTSTATTTGGGNWSASVGLNASSSNMLSIFATDELGNMSSSTLLNITHFNATSSSATSTPIITLQGDQNMSIFSCNGFTEPGFSAVDSTGVSIAATSTGAVNISTPGTYTITYTATDSFGHTATTTRTVGVVNCSSGSHGGGGGGGSTQVPPGLLVAVQNANPNSAVSAVLAGQVAGRVQGEVLGASIRRFLRELRQGDRGEDVAELQTRLKSTGIFKGPVTGYFGPITANAIRALQRGLGLTVTGRMDANVIMILNES